MCVCVYVCVRVCVCVICMCEYFINGRGKGDLPFRELINMKLTLVLSGATYD